MTHCLVGFSLPLQAALPAPTQELCLRSCPADSQKPPQEAIQRPGQGVRPGWMVTTYRPPNCGSDLGAPGPSSTGFPVAQGKPAAPSGQVQGPRAPQ